MSFAVGVNEFLWWKKPRAKNESQLGMVSDDFIMWCGDFLVPLVHIPCEISLKKLQHPQVSASHKKNIFFNKQSPLQIWELIQGLRRIFHIHLDLLASVENCTIAVVAKNRLVERAFT